jgi:hypothetical protein
MLQCVKPRGSGASNELMGADQHIFGKRTIQRSSAIAIFRETFRNPLRVGICDLDTELASEFEARP